MRHVLFVLPAVRNDFLSWQVGQLLRVLPRQPWEISIYALGACGPEADAWRASGIAVEAGGANRLLNLTSLVRLRSVVRELAPTVVHAWGVHVLPTLALTGFRGKLIHTPWLQIADERSWRRPLHTRLLRRAHRLLALGATDALRARSLGGESSRIVQAQPGIAFEDATTSSPSIPGLPAEARVILCAGPLELAQGFRDAIWALDILRYVHPDLHLVIAGTGAERSRLEHFASGLQVSSAVHFVPGALDLGPLVNRATLVWAPGRTEVGEGLLLQAMSAGRAVVASDWPRLRDLVQEGESGLLFASEDRTALARQTQRLLTDEQLTRRLTEAARSRVRTHFPAEALGQLCLAAYAD